MKELIRTLVEAWGPSGYEHHVRNLIRAEVADLADEIRVDALGNLICRIGEGGTKVMIAAHMDEIGVIVSFVDRRGYLRFTGLGTAFAETMFSHRVKFENGVTGTIAIEERFANRTRVPNMSKLYIDVSDGTDNVSVGVGDPATFWRNMEERGSRVIAKSLDNRLGCAVAIETMRRLKQSKSKLPNEVYFVFTVQEELGTRGAITAGFGVYPDMALAVDVTPTGDELKGVNTPVELGKGAVIKIMDVRHIVPPAVKNLLIDAAKKAKIPYQLDILTLGSTDAAAIQTAQGGVPSGAVSIPCRYVHTASETADLKDAEACVDLLTAVLSNPVTGIKPE